LLFYVNFITQSLKLQISCFLYTHGFKGNVYYRSCPRTIINVSIYPRDETGEDK